MNLSNGRMDTRLSKLYNLRFSCSAGVMDLGLTYKALASHQVDVIAGNSTDGLIDSLHFMRLRTTGIIFHVRRGGLSAGRNGA